VLLLTITAIVLLPYWHVPIAASVIAHWTFEEGTANTTASGVNSVLDVSGNSLHGTPFVQPVYRAVSRPGSTLGMEFSGGNERVSIADNPLFALTQSLTLEAFIRFDGFPAGTFDFSQILFRGDNRGARDPYFLAVDHPSGRLVFHIENHVGGASEVWSPSAIPISRFIHVAGTLDHATGRQTLYIGGIEVASQVTPIRPFGTLDPAWSPAIGIGNVGTALLAESFGGIIDDVRISDVALSPAQFLVSAPGTDYRCNMVRNLCHVLCHMAAEFLSAGI
jgi:hypothetical protein